MGKHLFLAHSAAPSGAELALLRLSEHLPPAKTVIMFAEHGGLIERYREAAVDVIVREALAGKVNRDDRSIAKKLAAIRSYISYGWKLGEWVNDSDITLIVANSFKSLLYGFVAAARARIPLVWSVHDRISSDYFHWADALLIRTLGLILPSAYIVNSQTTLDTVWAGNKPRIICPPGIERSAAPRAANDKSSVLTQVAMVGRLSPWKGQLLFIEAFNRVFKNTSVKAVVAGGALFGEHEYAAQVHATAAGSECADRISFSGNVNNVDQILHDSQILVHSSIIPEPFGAVVIEGLNAGCAVIATKPGGPSEVITDGHNGVLVQCGNVDAMESALRLLAENHKLREKLAENGAIRARDFDIRKIAQSLTTWLHSIEVGDATEKFSKSIPDKVR